MEIKKNTYKKICFNPECGKEFTCRHDNRKFCSVRCKRNFERDQKRKDRLKQLEDQKEMQKNMDILGSFFNAGKTKINIEDLKKKGFNANHYVDSVVSLNGEVIYSFEKFFLHKISKEEFIIKKINYVP